MSEQDLFIFIFAFALIAWLRWLWRIMRVGPMYSARSFRLPLLLVPIVSAVVVFWVLDNFASFDVRDSVFYRIFYTLLWLGWLGVVRKGIHLCGISYRDDVAERRNGAAQWVICGGVMALALCFAGGNIGDGPGWWVVLFAAAFSTGALFIFWFLFDLFTHATDAITIDRDKRFAIRFSGLLLAWGLVLGCGVAGDWVSGIQTLIDFLPFLGIAVGLFVVGIVIESALGIRRDSPVNLPLVPSFVAGGLYIGIAWLALNAMGWWK